MAILAPSRGCVYRVSAEGTAQGSGFFRVTELTTSSSSPSPILINGVTLRDEDVVLPVITLENTRVLYSFGADFGEIVVSGMILLGKAGEMPTSLATVVEFFQKNRVSKSGKTINVTGPKTSWKMFLTGLNIQEADPVFHIMPFALMGKIAQPE